MQLLYPNGDGFNSLGQTLAIHCFNPIDQGDSVISLGLSFSCSLIIIR